MLLQASPVHLQLTLNLQSPSIDQKTESRRRLFIHSATLTIGFCFTDDCIWSTDWIQSQLGKALEYSGWRLLLSILEKLGSFPHKINQAMGLFPGQEGEGANLLIFIYCLYIAHCLRLLGSCATICGGSSLLIQQYPAFVIQNLKLVTWSMSAWIQNTIPLKTKCRQPLGYWEAMKLLFTNYDYFYSKRW